MSNESVEYVAYALDEEQAVRLGAEADTILVQGYLKYGGHRAYTGEDIYVPGPTPNADAMDLLLRGAGWRRVTAWDTVNGVQHIATVERAA